MRLLSVSARCIAGPVQIDLGKFRGERRSNLTPSSFQSVRLCVVYYMMIVILMDWSEACWSFGYWKYGKTTANKYFQITVLKHYDLIT